MYIISVVLLMLALFYVQFVMNASVVLKLRYRYALFDKNLDMQPELLNTVQLCNHLLPHQSSGPSFSLSTYIETNEHKKRTLLCKL